MYLKALVIQGFKSFPEKTRLTFEKDITAIVGPNGSGKSNLSDAVLWVMGEQRSKTLRGDKMEDVIFGGTAVRPPMGYAEVSLILDNSSRVIDLDNNEIEITRRYYRSGESEYYINHESVRLKDLNGLLMDTGLGRDGYSIIGQGKIADIISTKSTDRREVFDEAAGISRFRYRKEEAERKLEKTEENLVRINDKIEELEYQVGPLKEQSDIAKKYLVLRDELRTMEISSWMATLDRLHEKSSSVNDEYNQAQKNLLNARAGLESLYASSDSISERLHNIDIESEEARLNLSKKESDYARCESSIKVLSANAQSTEETMSRLLKDIDEQDSRANEVKQNILDNENQVASIDNSLKLLAEEVTSNKNIIDGCRLKLSSRESALNSANEKLNRLTIDINTIASRISLLSEMEKEFEGFSKAVKTVMKDSSRGMIKGVHGPVANLIKTDENYALAIETALGASGQHIVVDSKEVGKYAIEMLKRNDCGRATFLPLDTIKGEILDDAFDGDTGYIGIAYDLVKCDSKYDEIVAYTLGKTIVLESLSDAVVFSKKYDDRFKLVTLDGQMINAGGSMTGGSTSRGTGILSRANELQSCIENKAVLEKELVAVEDDYNKARQNLSSIRYEMEMALEDKNTLSAKESSLIAEKNSILNTISQFNVLLEGISGGAEARKNAVEKAKQQIEEIKIEIQGKEKILAAINDELEGIKKVIDEIAKSKLELESKRSNTDITTKERFAEINELERLVARIEGKKNASDIEEKNILDKLWDNYELSYSVAQQLRQPVESLSKLNKDISEIKQRMNELGTPNLGAIDEYERVSSRYEFLTTQRDDVEAAKSDLLNIIKDVTSEMEKVFVEQFKLIDTEFKKTFTELFNGGKASLELDDEDNILESGIEIKVQPPGKSVSTISLLSGGEKAFVAIALYFAILKVRPTPFCIMDEIEAALDESNVAIFAEYLRNMSNKTQFLVITHRRGTMEEADMLYGVTMQEKGVTTVIELDLNEAKKTVENA